MLEVFLFKIKHPPIGECFKERYFIAVDLLEYLEAALALVYCIAPGITCDILIDHLKPKIQSLAW